jgi:hypothetical protein
MLLNVFALKTAVSTDTIIPKIAIIVITDVLTKSRQIAKRRSGGSARIDYSGKSLESSHFVMG